MSEHLPISVQILTYNSAKSLARAIESVFGSAEILVIDGGSTDQTRMIATEYGVRIIEQCAQNTRGSPLTNFAEARNKGLLFTKEPWVLALDSDEYASPELMEELHSITETGTPCACCIPRKYVLQDGKIVTHATTYPNERLYFFHRSCVTEWKKPVHEKPELKTGTLINHCKGASMAPLGSLKEYKQKNLRYLCMEIENDRGKGWNHWFVHRLLHTLRSRCIALIKLLWIWCLPHKNCVRLPLKHEHLRFWYGWKLVVKTCPLFRNELLKSS